MRDNFRNVKEENTLPRHVVQSVTIGRINGVQLGSIEIEDSFYKYFCRLMIKHGFVKESDIYNKAGIEGSKFGKYRDNEIKRKKGSAPKKETVLALAVAMELGLEETTELMSKAGHAFNTSSEWDLTIKRCIEMRMYDFDAINAYLYDMGLDLLGPGSPEAKAESKAERKRNKEENKRTRIKGSGMRFKEKGIM